jgi:DtxR family Mn-dependent transcriptional regulator
MKNDREFHTFRGYQMLKQDKRLLTDSMEDYLEMIFRNCEIDGYVRINTLARQLNVRAPSVSRIVQKLSKLGLVNYQRYGVIQLTGRGKDIGQFLLNRHRTIESFLKRIGVKESALRDTEMIEHHISMETYRNLEILGKYMEQNPAFIEGFAAFKSRFGDDAVWHVGQESQ